MMLEAVEYVQYAGQPLEWRIEGLSLQPINLLVGRNASGKSKALGLIRELAEMVSGTGPSDRSGSYVARFRDPDSVYELDIADARVRREDLSIGGDKKLTRGHDGAGTIYFQQLGKFVAFQSPDSDLACGRRRDSIQHPYLEGFHDWGAATLSYEFSSAALGKGTLAFIPEPMIEHPRISESLEEPGILRAIHAVHTDAFGGDLRATVVRDMNRLGYSITAVTTRRSTPRSDQGRREKGALVSLCVAEAGLGDLIDQFDMSEGMFRALVVLIEVTYLAMSGKPRLLLIDDIGEGLDYERSCLLIQLLIEKAKTSGIQLVMTTNDRFVMNNVPLEHWSVLVRKPAERGTVVKVYNHENSQKTFDEFALTGLNNFDFFATSFFEHGLGGDE
jgi:AAA domain, putative AbiEii toxin, Type IV TA system